MGLGFDSIIDCCDAQQVQEIKERVRHSVIVFGIFDGSFRRSDS
jgi:hypothetical protein